MLFQSRNESKDNKTLKFIVDENGIVLGYNNDSQKVLYYGRNGLEGKFIGINKRFFDYIVSIITDFFYPYINMHEVIGDCFVLIVNAEWTYTCLQFCASLAIDFINRLLYRTESYVSVRSGVSYGKIIYGFIGTSFRFFGNPMHVAVRL